ncbi:MAG: hypothetical protein M3O80_05205 [Chloroflexota bacterium]|nr:hypothetical protein [Chloroflexota bacterium]
MRDMSGWLPGVILIVVGASLFLVQLLHLDADVIVLVIGLVFTAAFALTRRYGLLIPAGILTGLGAGILLEDLGVAGEPVMLGLGLGFLAIYAVDALTSGAREPGRWWPLIPGAIVTVIAGASGTFGEQGARAIEQGWPILLIALGAWLLLRGRVST